MAPFQERGLINSVLNSQLEMHKSISEWEVVCSLGVESNINGRVVEGQLTFSLRLLENYSAMYINWSWKAKQVVKKKGRILRENETTTTGQIILNHKLECSHWQRHKGNIFTRMNSPRKICSPISDTTRPFLPCETWMSPFSTSSFSVIQTKF